MASRPKIRPLFYSTLKVKQNKVVLFLIYRPNLGSYIHVFYILYFTFEYRRSLNNKMAITCLKWQKCKKKGHFIFSNFLNWRKENGLMLGLQAPMGSSCHLPCLSRCRSQKPSSSVARWETGLPSSATSGSLSSLTDSWLRWDWCSGKVCWLNSKNLWEM